MCLQSNDQECNGLVNANGKNADTTKMSPKRMPKCDAFDVRRMDSMSGIHKKKKYVILQSAIVDFCANFFRFNFLLLLFSFLFSFSNSFAHSSTVKRLRDRSIIPFDLHSF